MRLIDSITPLLLDSKLFYDPERIRPADKKKRKGNLTHMGIKIGQGGTLDPLADGVLGALIQVWNAETMIAAEDGWDGKI